MKLEIHHYYHSLTEARIMAAISELKEIIMGTQETINQLTEQINAAKTTIVEKIEVEAQQVRDFIANNPEVDTSALSAAVAGLENLGASVSQIFPDAPPVEEEPVV